MNHVWIEESPNKKANHGKEDAANNFARGHYTIGKEIVAVVAVGGGTRSGSLLLETEDEWKITTEAKRAKRWIRRARVGPPEG